MATPPADPEPQHSGRVIAVMSTFHPGDAAVENARIARDQVDDLIVVDDGSSDDADAVLDAITAAGATVIRSDENRGIAAALNTGTAEALRSAPGYVLFLDQDSSLPSGFVASLLAAHRDSGGIEAGVAGAAPEHFGTVRQGRRTRDGEVVPMPIQSGLLPHRDVFARVGTLREDLFIDLVDFDYALRMTDAGLRVAAAPGVALPHELGRQVGLRLFGQPLGPRRGFTVSTPFRYYYRARNRVLVFRAHWRGHLARMLADLALDLRHAMIVLAAVRQRGELFHLMRAGWTAGLRGRGGAMPEALRRRAARIEWRHPL